MILNKNMWIIRLFTKIQTKPSLYRYVNNHHRITFVCAVESSEGHHKEGGGVFAGVDEVREGSLGVTVTTQTLYKPEPGRQTLDHRPHAVRVRVTHVSTCHTRDTHIVLGCKRLNYSLQ